jgi:hypothetical protein
MVAFLDQVYDAAGIPDRIRIFEGQFFSGGIFVGIIEGNIDTSPAVCLATACYREMYVKRTGFNVGILFLIHAMDNK